MRPVGSRWYALALGVSALGLGGCGGFDRLDFEYNSAPPDSAVVDFEQIRIHEGIAFGVKALPMDGDDLMDEETLVELSSKNPGVLGVGHGVADDPDDEDVANWNFVLFGVSPGITEVTVRIDGSVEGTIEAIVEAQ